MTIVAATDSKAVAMHADQLRRWIVQGSRDERDHLRMANEAGLPLSHIEAIISRADAIDDGLWDARRTDACEVRYGRARIGHLVEVTTA